MNQIAFILILSLATLSVFSQEPGQGNDEPRSILIRYATAHIGDGSVINNSYIIIENGEISRVTDANKARIDVSRFDTIIEASGKHVYPGFIVMDSRLGLVEIGAVRATHDYNEVGLYNPNTRSIPAFNSESKIISTVRTNGVLMAQVAPVGGVISGSSSLVHFDGWNWQDASIAADEGLFMNWPQRYRKTGWWAEPGGSKVNKKYQDQIEEITAYFKEAKAYQSDSQIDERNLRFESMNGIYAGSQRLYIRANWARDILDAIIFVRELDIKNACIVGGAEAHLVSTELKENDIPVLIDRVHKLPVHEDAPIDEPFELAAKLVASGVKVAFATSGSMEAMTSRNLPFNAGTSVAFGLEYEEAIKAMTLVPAELMGVDKHYGSLESGKRATLFISNGDALEIVGNDLDAAFIEGRLIDLSNHQSELYTKFSRKHGVSEE